VILRLFETHRQRGKVKIHVPPNIRDVQLTSLLEEPGTPLSIDDGVIELEISPFQIVTLRLRA